jgi:hypothetical protein
LPLASERSDTVLVLRNSSSKLTRRAPLRADDAALRSLAAGASVDEDPIPTSVPLEPPSESTIAPTSDTTACRPCQSRSGRRTTERARSSDATTRRDRVLITGGSTPRLLLLLLVHTVRSSRASLHVYLIPRAFHFASLFRRAPLPALPPPFPLSLPLRVRSLVVSRSSTVSLGRVTH